MKLKLRNNIAQMVAYEAARHTVVGQDFLLLDANESPFDNGINRYPDPFQRELKKKIADFNEVKQEMVFLGNGSDEILDLLIRAFCEPGQDEILIVEPTYGMYKILAQLNGVGIRSCQLNEDFSLNTEEVLQTATCKTKIIFLCSPNNPTGNLLSSGKIEEVLQGFNGLVVIDEAYIDFSDSVSWIKKLSKYVQLFVVQTFSKSLSGAFIRLGMGFSHPDIIAVLNRIKPPYNISGLTQNAAINILSNRALIAANIQEIIQGRNWLFNALKEVSCVRYVYPSQANFLLVIVTNADRIIEELKSKGIIVRNRSTLNGCANAIRISVGTSEENKRLINCLKQIK